MAVNHIIRRLHHLNSIKGDIQVEINWPVPSQEDWACHFQITDTKDTVILEKTAHGIDALQALLLAIEAVRAVLQEKFPDYQWQGNPTHGQTGISRMTPAYLPKIYTDNIDNYIDEQVSDFLKQITPEKP